MKKILLIIIVVVFIAFVTNVAPSGEMNSVIQSIQVSVTTIAYAGEFGDIQKTVDEFLVLRSIKHTDEGKLLAAKMDERINKLELVKIYCSQEISTLELANEKNPYEKLQQLCPSLSSVSFSKAVQLFRMI